MAEPTGGSAPPPPRANPDLMGHDAAETALRHLVASRRLPHALLITGPRGIGKATLAYRFARFLFAHWDDAASDLRHGGGLGVAANSGVFRRVASGGHADLLTVERGYDPRRRRQRSEITVDDTREVARFLRLTPAEGGWRIVVVDGADEMNRNAANALLKVLEEPPQRALLVLVAHSPGLLLPTIRSRCRRFPLPPLPPSTVARLLACYRPDLPEAQIAALTALAAGSIGRAIDLAESGGVELYEAVLRLLSSERGLDPAALQAFADRLARGEADNAYRALEELISQLLAEVAVCAARGGPAAASHAALRRLGERAPAARWAELRNDIAQSFVRGDALNLDRKQTILGAFFAIERVAR
jgi:DNA polymerase-3 subunit delta'